MDKLNELGIIWDPLEVTPSQPLTLPTLSNPILSLFRISFFEPNPLGNKARCLANRCTKVCNGPNFVKVIRDFLVFVGGRGQLDTT